MPEAKMVSMEGIFLHLPDAPKQYTSLGMVRFLPDFLSSNACKSATAVTGPLRHQRRQHAGQRSLALNPA